MLLQFLFVSTLLLQVRRHAGRVGLTWDAQNWRCAPLSFCMLCAVIVTSIAASNYLIEAARWMSGYQPYACSTGLSAVVLSAVPQVYCQGVGKAARWTSSGGRGEHRFRTRSSERCLIKLDETLVVRWTPVFSKSIFRSAFSPFAFIAFAVIRNYFSYHRLELATWLLSSPVHGLFIATNSLVRNPSKFGCFSL